MSRKNESPQKAAMREMMKNYLKDADLRIQDGSDVKNIMRDMMSVLLEGALDGELDDSLGYNKYDYKNKDTGNSRNGHSNKTMHTSYGDMVGGAVLLAVWSRSLDRAAAYEGTEKPELLGNVE